MYLFLAMTSLCLASASAAALEGPSSFSKLDNDSMKADIQNYTEKSVTEIDLLKSFDDPTIALPDLTHVNRCAYPGTCASSHVQNCQRCQTGYFKDPEDDTKCKYENENAIILAAGSNNITMVSLDGKETSQVIETEPISAFSRHIDYNFKMNKIFWYSRSDRKIYTALLSNVDSKKESIMQNDSLFITVIAVDWIYNHIYWVNTVNRILNQICVSNFNGTMKKVLYSDGFTGPLLIVVNPLNGWMYWTDKEGGRIERASLDGSKRENVLDTEVYSPYGLALDLVEKRLYWSHKNDVRSIWSSNFDGSDRKLVFEEPKAQLSYAYFRKIGIFDKYVYLMDSGDKLIYKVNKCNGQELEVAYKSTFRLWDFKMYHSTLQPEGKNLCSKRIYQCSHFCLPAPSLNIEDSVSTTTCACPDGLYLSSDQQNCMSQI